MKRALTAAAKPIAVLLLALVAVHPLLHSSLPWSADGQLHFWRLVELDHCLRNGYLYPRWMPDLAYGYGFPLLNYYAPLSVYLAEGFHLLGLGFTAALLAALSAGLALGALGAYLWAREAFGEAGGLIAAVAYTYAPYTLYDAIWRGNLAETLALGLLPWVFWRLRRLALDGSGRNLALAALAFAALVLSHNITALIASPLLAGYALLLWLTTGRSRKALGLLAGALALGLALSAFFWLPALLEREFVQTAKIVTASHFDYRHNFLNLGELLSPPAPIDVTLMNPQVPRSLGWTALALAALGVVGSWKVDSSLRWQILGAFAALVLCAFLTLSASQFLWQSVPLLPYVGFPWRFLGPAGLMAAWLAGAPAGRWRPGARVVGVGLATLATVVFALTWLYPRYLEPMEDLTPAGIIAFEQTSGALGTTSIGEYLPGGVKELPDTTALEAQYRAGGSIRRLMTESLPEGATIVSHAWRLVGGDMTVDSPRDWTATLWLFYFPGWRVWLNGVEIETTPTSPHGLMRFAVPAGESHIKVRFGSTPWRLAGAALSAAGLIALAGMVVRTGLRLAINRQATKLKPAEADYPRAIYRPLAPQPNDLSSGGQAAAPEPAARSTRYTWAGALAVVGLVLAAKAIYLDTHDSPVRYAGFDGRQVTGVGAPEQIRFDDGIRLLGHDPATPAVEAGGSLSLRLYWTASAPPGEEYSSFLHLVDAEGHRWGQSDNQHPGGYPTVRWRPGEYNRDAHTLAVLPGTPPGNYTLRAGLLARATGAGLDVLDERGAPAGTSVAIGSVTVTRPKRPLPVEALDVAHRLDVHLGDLTLLGVSLDRRQATPGETLLLTLYWRAERPPAQDYAVSVAALDESGAIVATTALPPAATTYPTGQWIAGEIVRGQHWLTLPAGLDTGAYALRVTLLEAEGRPIGTPVSLAEGGQITVVAPERQTVIPPMGHRLDANFADRATLLGYDLVPETAQPGETLRLTLYWRAEQPMPRSYAVFAHLLDANSRIVAQHDGLPANWTRPTTGWLPGEVIVDAHDLVLETGVPPGAYLLEAGLYDPETGVRLPVLDAAGQIIADRALLAPVSVEP